MSLNEIIDNPSDNSGKYWQDYTVNNLDISQNFNINTAGAVPGSVLQLNGSLQKTWVPFSSFTASSMEYCTATFSTASIPVGQTPSLISATGLSGSPTFQLVGGEIQVNEAIDIIVFLNITSIPTPNVMPLITLRKVTPNSTVTTCEMSPFLTSIYNSTPYTSCNSIVPMQTHVGDKIAVLGSTVGNSSIAAQLITAESNISIIRVN